MKELLNVIFKNISPQLAFILMASTATIGIGAKINETKQAIVKEIEHNRAVVESMEQTQAQISAILDKQDVIILYVSDIADIQKKTAAEIIKMIREAAKKPP